jgi:hypothetical protein
MKNLTLRFTVAVLTFVVGITVAGILALRSNAPLDPHWVYISKDIPWQLPPKEIVDDMGVFYEGVGSLMVFYPSGELALARCRFRRSGKSKEISLGGLVEFSIAKGTWSRNSDKTITTKTRFCVAPMGFDAGDGATNERQWETGHEDPNRVVLMHKDEYMIPLPDDFRDIDELVRLLRFAAKCE